LSDIVYSEYKGLDRFLFSDTLLVKDPSTAYALGLRGFRAVSVDGELFEPSGVSMSLDFGSKISNLTKAILLSGSVESLRAMLDRLGQLIGKANRQLGEVQSKIADCEAEKVRLEIGLGNVEGRLELESNSVAQRQKTLEEIKSTDSLAVLDASVQAAELEKHK